MTTTVGQLIPLTCQGTAQNRSDDAQTLLRADSTTNEIKGAFENAWSALAPYVALEVAKSILSAPKSHLQLRAKKQEMTVLFADIRGFTALAEQVEPEDCLQILNDYYSLAVDDVFNCGGTVDKFQGDCVMATFCATPERADHEYRAVECAVRLREAVWNIRIPQMPEQRIRLGIGVNSGVAIVGRVGSSKRMDYTAIGDVVNVAHRLQSLSKPDQILISQNTRRRIGQVLKVEELGSLYLRGRAEPVSTCAVQHL